MILGLDFFSEICIMALGARRSALGAIFALARVNGHERELAKSGPHNSELRVVLQKETADAIPIPRHSDSHIEAGLRLLPA
jgi:hypothetical protein